MARHTVVLDDFVIANGGTISNIINNKDAFAFAVDFIIWAPTALTGTVTVEVAPDEGSAAGEFRALQVTPGTDNTVAAGKAPVVAAGGFKAMRLVSGSAEGAERTFPFRAQVDMST